MFAHAYEIVRKFTLPLVVAFRQFDKKVLVGAGAMVILNNEGWFASVAHAFQPSFDYQRDRPAVDTFMKQVHAIETDHSKDEGEKRKSMSQLTPNPNWVTDLTFFGLPAGTQLKDARLLAEADLLVARLEPFEPSLVQDTYPILKDPKVLRPGTSLCKLGFPFHSIGADFDEGTKRFSLTPGAFPMPLFPIEGIFTRHMAAGKSADGKYDIKFLETSSPGLRGQSGGPIFDTKGTIWGIQSHTESLPLDFRPKVGGVEEHQFLNVGRGVHPDVLVTFLRDQGVPHAVSDY
jgi:hypothetical protein